MPNHYSKNSQANLDSCAPGIILVFTEVLQIFDHSIICGYRSQNEQGALFLEGKTKVRLGEHNCIPSRAVDAIPYPIKPDWNEDLNRIILFAGIVKGVAHSKGVLLRWGGDWDGDNDLSDQTFNDYVHFEEVRPR